MGNTVYNPMLKFGTFSGDKTLAASDFGKYFTFTGTNDGILSIVSVSTLPAGWYIDIENATTANWLAFNFTMDGVAVSGGVSSYSFPHEIRRISVNGGAFYSEVKRPFVMEYNFSLSFPCPSGYRLLQDSFIWGGGGGGAKSSASAYTGGAGGGACVPLSGIALPPAGTLITVTVGTGGTAGASASTNGGVGGTTTVTWSGGPSISAYGGGGGGYGGGSGGGGGWQSAGGSASNTTGGAGGAPLAYASGPTYNGVGIGGVPGQSVITAAGISNTYGGAGGAPGGNAASAGGSTLWGGPGAGSLSNVGGVGAPGVSKMTGATAGASSSAGTAGAGSGYGAAGGSTQTGTAGPGAAGAARLSAI